MPSTRRRTVDGWRRCTSPEKRWDTLAIVAMVLGAVLRIGWILVVHPPVDFVYSDMKGYVDRAELLAAGGPLGPNDAFYPPGTQILLSIPIKIFGSDSGLWAAAVLWCALSIAVVWLAWRLTKELLTPAAAGITAMLCALSPLYITFGGYFTSETPALAFLLASLWLGTLATRRTGRTTVMLALLCGLSGGVATAIRPQLLMNVVIMTVVVFFACRRRMAPLAGLGIGLVSVLALVVVHNSVAANRATGLSTNGGLNFWFGHCEARGVETFDGAGERTAWFTHPVPNQLGRGGDYDFTNVDVWDEDFFYRLGRDCIERDGAGHVVRLARNVLDMTATTAPFPQADDQGAMRDVVQAANIAYAVLLPWLIIESMFLIYRRRRVGEPAREAFLLLNLACVVVVAVLILGDPRVRSVYDVFGFALLAALLADRFHLDDTAASAEPELTPEPRSS